jgi:hypothetical protein
MDICKQMGWALEQWLKLSEYEQERWLEREEERRHKLFEAIHWAAERGSPEAMTLIRLQLDLL